MADHLYLVPIETVGTYRGPAYFRWRFGTGTITTPWSMMDYGLLPTGLVWARELSPADEALLAAAPDVYQWPDNLDQPITDTTLAAFFEGLNIPANWLQPSTTYRELLRMMAGIFQFAQRFQALSGGLALFGDGVTLDTNYRQTGIREAWIDATLASFEYSPVQGNPQLRSVVKRIGDTWAQITFELGGFRF